jgi:putative SbcD/Mre11-related phosphoesterase
MVQPVLNEPALFLKDISMLVIADLHIGIETELRQQGLSAPSQRGVMTKRLLSLLKTYQPEELVLLGDIKHNIPSSTIRERGDVRRFLQEVTALVRVHVVPGNHDGNIHKLLPSGIQLHSSKGFFREGYGFIHGHRWPGSDIMSSSQVIFGHSHPMVMLRDRLGYRSFEPCWLRGMLRDDTVQKWSAEGTNTKVIVVPAFNSLCGGIAVNEEPLLGPMGKVVDMENAEIYLLDGSSLGKIRDMALLGKG